MTATLTAEDELRRQINGYQVSQAIAAMAALRVADVLVDGERSSDDLADELHVDQDGFARLVNALIAIGLLSRADSGKVRLTERGALLRSDTPNSLAAWAEFIGSPPHWNAWGALLHNVRTGENGFTHVNGADPWTYRSNHPDASRLFDRAMTSLSSVVLSRVIESYDFGQFSTIVDVGGGNGRFLGSILVANPESRGIVFDLPHVVEGASDVLHSLGVSDRCQAVGGSFFDSVPSGGDAYILKSTLHDWADGECRTILGICRENMSPGASVLIVERELGGPNERWEARFSDLNMLVGPGGRERTVAEYSSLLTESGFQLQGSTSCGSGQVVIRGAALATQ